LSSCLQVTDVAEISPDRKSAFLAYLDATGKGVHIQQVDPKTFTAAGTPVTVNNGKEGFY
jgi:hypothetical protein